MSTGHLYALEASDTEHKAQLISSARKQNSQDAQPVAPNLAPAVNRLANAIIDTNISTNKEQNYKNKFTQDRGIFWATVGLVCVGIGQIILFWVQLRYMRKSLKETQSQVELSRQEFNATHRPKLMVRRINMLMEEDGNLAGQEENYCVLYNIGELDAIITEYNISLVVYNESGVPLFPIYPEYATKKITQVVRPGEYYRLDLSPENMSEIAKMDSELAAGFAMDKSPLRCVGYVKYGAPDSKVRETAFMRVYSYPNRRFTPVDDPDYEYAD